ncbi:hypothetical protein [Neoaquamicrobium sediminum]|uniref:hypothetical protein n=1 Tax=Neoaquamicrobium sediminum TaxID=1849104 RepID=UPI003BA928FB
MNSDKTCAVARYADFRRVDFKEGEQHIPIDEFPVAESWHDRLMELPAWRSPFTG